MFRLISRSEFTPKIFEEYPVWSEHYDYDEIEEIASWGIDRKWLLEEIKTKHSGNDHCYYPILKINPLPDRMFMYIKAEISTKNGKLFSGYVINENAYCVGIFTDKSELIFNKNISLKSQFHIANIQKLENIAGNDYFSIFPLVYKTEFFSKVGEKIQGEFTLNE